MEKKPANILVITTWGYREGLIQSSTLPYLKMIHEVIPTSRLFLVTQEKQAWYKNKQVKETVDQELQQYNIYLLPQLYQQFGFEKMLVSFFQFFKLFWVVLTKNISYIHCFCTPAGATGYLLSVLSGKKLVIDSYEPHAESMVENGTWRKGSFAFRLLWWLEKKQSSRASYYLAAASGMDQYAREKYGVELAKWGVRPACVELDTFRYNEAARQKIRGELGWEHKIVVIYAGKFGGIYLDKEVFDFFKVAHDYWGDQFRVLLLTTNTENELRELCSRAGFPFNLIHNLSVPHHQVPNYLSSADFAITPVKPVPSKKYCSPIKDGEYWAIGLPVVITKNISDDSYIIGKHRAGAVINDLDKEEYQKAIGTIDQLLQENRYELRMRIRSLAETYRNYEIARAEYNKIYGNAISRKSIRATVNAIE
jgi:hypothetical protein